MFLNEPRGRQQVTVILIQLNLRLWGSLQPNYIYYKFSNIPPVTNWKNNNQITKQLIYYRPYNNLICLIINTYLRRYFRTWLYLRYTLNDLSTVDCDSLLMMIMMIYVRTYILSIMIFFDSSMIDITFTHSHKRLFNNSKVYYELSTASLAQWYRMQLTCSRSRVPVGPNV